jgi:hypothetical protein
MDGMVGAAGVEKWKMEGRAHGPLCALPIAAISILTLIDKFKFIPTWKNN